ncbi:MAG: tRNA (adenosine(37)-N6)-threonylcarbamoyltransferase complex dimerization subunit type 1 TsaB [Cellvibrionaceae bacterium]|nr:tRNA (adenosine(37)-N6)-threonylcarbamoyltransferase complex dimerization subunit type 1 TsaB [Cellvibrionaceae bacterium]
MTCILALDTSSDACSIALLHRGEIHSDVNSTPREHTQRALPMIHRLLALHQLTLASLDAIAYGCGPGSFTGLRIGLSIAQGLAYGADIPLLPISSLQAMACAAYRHKALQAGTLIAPVIDARMHEVYWSAYAVDDCGELQALMDETVATPVDCAAALAQLALPTAPDSGLHVQTARPAVIQGVGSGWQYEPLSRVTASYDVAGYPDAYDIAKLAAADWLQGRTVAAERATLVYLRNEITWKKRQRLRPVSH